MNTKITNSENLKNADVYANASDATYIPIVLGENTAVSLDVGTTGLYIYSAEIVTTKDRW